MGWLLLVALVGAGTWEKASDGDGIEVWVRDVANSDIREVKASAVIEAPARRVWEVLADTAHYVEFMPYVEEARTVGDHAAGHYEYQRIDPPIVSRRDYTVKVSLKADDASGVYTRKWQSANDRGPPLVDGVVRVQVNQGQWTITAAGPSSTHIEYYLYTDPGGSLPTWVANKANTTSVPDLLKAVRNRSVNPKWKR